MSRLARQLSLGCKVKQLDSLVTASNLNIARQSFAVHCTRVTTALNDNLLQVLKLQEA